VICVGNLVAGGAGKTPVALALAELLKARGVGVHILTRGYGGRLPGPLRVELEVHDAGDVGDEALLLAACAPTWVARDRLAGARAAAAAGAAALVLDDGFQNPALAKDLSVLVIDGTYGLGNGRVMPAGPLREAPGRALARADAVVLIGEDRAGIETWLGGRPLLRAELVPAPDAPDLAGQRVLAFAGIGRPEKVFATLEACGAELVERRAFPDHHPYGRSELDALIARAAALDARPVTTEKDAARLPADLRAAVAVLPVVLRWGDPAAAARLLDRLSDHGKS
jgi:tetraacyldisaccharide 4'-kinase